MNLYSLVLLDDVGTQGCRERLPVIENCGVISSGPVGRRSTWRMKMTLVNGQFVALTLYSGC